MAVRLPIRLALAILVALAMLGGCRTTGTHIPGRSAVGADEVHLQRVIELRKALRRDPQDAGLQHELRRLESAASQYYLAKGAALLDEGRADEAVALFELGMLAQPENAALHEARVTALRRKEIVRLYEEAERARTVGNFDLAETLLQRALDLDRDNPRLEVAMAEITAERDGQDQRYVLEAMDSVVPMSMNFRGAQLSRAMETIAAPYDLNLVFDREAGREEVTVSARDVSFGQAFHMLLEASDTFHKVIGPNSVLIAKNTAEKQKQYRDLYFRTFHLQVVKASKMAELLRGAMELQTLVANDDLNTIQVRADRETLSVVKRLIATNDRKPAEIMLDVEILEVNRTKSEQLGLDYGSQITARFPNFTFNQAFDGTFARAVLGEGTVTLPTVTLKYFKDDVDAQILAKPRVRTMDGKEAKIHIGDRVPLRSSTVQDATGQTRTTFDYRDIGIRLDVTPKYHLDGSVTVVLALEVSSLGQNLGTPNDPAFSIGTRNVNTSMLLRDGETAILGGLIRDEERRRWNKVPGLSRLPAVGRLFAVKDDQDVRTDLILTVTPRVVRSQSLPQLADTDFFSGKQGRYGSKRPFHFLRRLVRRERTPRFAIDDDGDDRIPAFREEPTIVLPSRDPGDGADIVTLAPDNDSVVLAFSEPLYSVGVGETVTVELLAGNLALAKSLSARVLFNPDKLVLDQVTGLTGRAGRIDASRTGRPGSVAIDLSDIPARAAAGEVPIARLRLRGVAPGLSYLIVNTEGQPVGPGGEPVATSLGSSKVSVR